MNASRIPLAVFLVVSGIALADDGDAPKDQPAKFKITTKRKDDTVEVKAEKDRTVFSLLLPVVRTTSRRTCTPGVAWVWRFLFARHILRDSARINYPSLGLLPWMSTNHLPRLGIRST